MQLEESECSSGYKLLGDLDSWCVSRMCDHLFHSAWDSLYPCYPPQALQLTTRQLKRLPRQRCPNHPPVRLAVKVAPHQIQTDHRVFNLPGCLQRARLRDTVAMRYKALLPHGVRRGMVQELGASLLPDL